MDTLLMNGSRWYAAIYLLASNLPKRRIEIQPRAKSSKRKIKENSANSFPSTQAVFHCLSEIHAKVTIFQAGSKVYWSKVRTFCMFYSVFRHITHKSLPLLLGEQQKEFVFNNFLKLTKKLDEVNEVAAYIWGGLCTSFLHSIEFLRSSQLDQFIDVILHLHLNNKLFHIQNCLFRTNILVKNTWVLKYFWIILPHIP